MHVIIDLLGAQLELKDNRSDVYFSKTMQWLEENNIKNFYLILHDNISDTEQLIRKKIKNKSNIRKFFNITTQKTEINKKASKELYLKFIKSLNPSIIIIDKKIKNLNIYNLIYKNKTIKTILLDNPSTQKPNKPTSKIVKNKKSHNKKLKLAFVSPLPPEKTGIACYAEELSKYLSAHYEIIYITDQKDIKDDFINQHCSLKSSQWLLEKHDIVDRVIYHIGNSSFHAKMFELIQQVPGIVVLHDFFIGDVIWYNEAHNLIPHALNRALYNSHGYIAVKEKLTQPEPVSAISNYPANFEILTSALGTIFHSNYAIQLLQNWYPSHDLSIAQIPHLRGIKTPTKSDSLSKLGYPQNAFIVASFGFLGSSKCNFELLQAWQESSIANDTNAHLIFVGDGGNNSYQKQLQDFIHQHHLTRVKITGFAHTETYQHYLSAASIAVQLRTLSRGETSGTVLDCMAHGLPVIINQNGSMAEIDPNATLHLPDQFSIAQLKVALETLYKDYELRATLSRNAQKSIELDHSPHVCAERYAEAIEDFYKYKNILDFDFYKNLTPLTQKLSDAELMQLANTIAHNFPSKKAQRTLFVDVSVVAHDDFKTGIQRVVRALTLELLNNPPHGFRIEPIYLSEVDGKWLYYSARSYSSKLLNISDHWLPDEPTEFHNNDIFLGLDLAGGYVIKATQQGLYEHLKNLGVHIAFVVYDLIPILFEQFYSSDDSNGHAQWLHSICQADTVVCISQAVSQDLQNWLQAHKPERLPELNIRHFHLGADIEASSPSVGFPEHGEQILEQLKAQTSFLMVGTVEPRKGHWQTLKAFEQLWAQGHKAHLVIVGKEGWLIDEFATELNQHPELNRRLYWFTDISDEYLVALYDACAGLIAASYCEGFGLPLIEAAKHKLPIIARDLPVFREVAQQHAFYFDSQTPEQLALALLEWMSLYELDEHPKSLNMPWLTWQVSAQQLLDTLITDASINTAELTASNGSSKQTNKKRLLIDLSATCRNDLKTGIERVARALLLALTENPPEGYSVAPIYLSDIGNVWHYRYAHTYLANLQNNISQQEDCAVEPGHGDVILGLDISGEMLIQAASSGLFKRYRTAGVSTFFMVHDLLPISMPEVFPATAKEGHTRWLEAVMTMDGVICVSKSVAKDMELWIKNQPAKNKNSNFLIQWSHHGADVVNSSPSKGLPKYANDVLAELAQRPSFVLVGTIEPRKGYLQTIQAFDLLRKQGIEVNLVIVGHEGWKGLEDHARRDIPATVEALRTHPELNKYLFWLEGISDEFLEQVYAASSCLIAASYGEGFGLPLIEAAQKGIPIIARDIPVFREVAGEHAHYFTANHPEELANAIKIWLQLYSDNQHTHSKGMPWLSWQQSAENLHTSLLKHLN